MKLIIFDLDQTLVDFLDTHNKALRRLFLKLFRIEADFTQIDYAGRSLPDNFAELARINGISEDSVKGKMQSLLEDYDRSFIEAFPANPAQYVLPGVKPLLENLTANGDMLVLYTGDSSAIANKALTETSLKKYFRFSVHGNEFKSRVDMARKAIEKAEKLANRKFQGKDVVIIGDSIRDVECGKELGTLTIAVATGPYSKEKIARYKPDYIFENLKDYKKVLEAIG